MPGWRRPGQSHPILGLGQVPSSSGVKGKTLRGMDSNPRSAPSVLCGSGEWLNVSEPLFLGPCSEGDNTNLGDML